MLCKSGVEEPLRQIQSILNRLELTLNEDKTRVVDAKRSSFNFLGFTLMMGRGVKSGKSYPKVRPSDPAVRAIKARLTQLSRRELTVIPLSYVVENMNRSLRGWVNYFHFRNSSHAVGKVRYHAESRLRNHLMKRHKIPNRKMAISRFPRQDLYTRYGLFELPMGAGWRSAHASV